MTPPIALVLSGGGVRAMAFHMGVLRALAEHGQLESVQRISSVSGGSLLVGLILHECKMIWPASATFADTVYPSIRSELCARSLQWGALRQLIRPWNWRHLLSRANLLAATLRNEWGVQSRLADLPAVPEWSINGTNAENGRRFRFKRDNLGDYLTGYADPRNFRLADAMAVSAAFPGAIGPLRLDARRFEWRRREWQAPPGSEQIVHLPGRTLHLYDGGVYDNLGLEPFFDAGRCQAKQADQYILVSDAGLPLSPGFSFGAFNPYRLKRVADIMSDQSHALRLRTFHEYIRRAPSGGGIIYIGDSASSDHGEDRSFTAAFPTTLRRLEAIEFDRIASHGYRLAQQTILRSLCMGPMGGHEGTGRDSANPDLQGGDKGSQ